MNFLKKDNKISNMMNFFQKTKKDKVSSDDKKEAIHKAAKANKDEK